MSREVELADTAGSTHTGIGSRQLRLEDETILRGRARYVADLPIPDLAHAVFVRSPVAHARIRELDISMALRASGVVDVITARALQVAPVRFPAYDSIFLSAFHHRLPIASDTVRFVGEVVAIVVAETLAEAVDAAELVDVSYEALPAVVTADDALQPGAIVLFAPMTNNVVLDQSFSAGTYSARADYSIRCTISNPKMGVAPLEPSGIRVLVDSYDDRLVLYPSTQMPHAFRDLTALFLNMNPDQLRVVTPAVGGGFGGKVPAEPDYVAIVAAARLLGRSLSWVQTRHENLLTMIARGARFDVELHADAAGKILSYQVEALADGGAYPGIGCGNLMTTRSMATGPYVVPHIRFDSRAVATNTAPVGSFRGAGRPEATAILERAMDQLAFAMGLDAVEIRRRNLIPDDEFPYMTLTGVQYDSGRYLDCLDCAIELVGYDDLRTEQALRRADNDASLLGIGISFFVELSAQMAGFNTEYASVEILPNGRARVLVGTSAHGQGHHTVFAQIAASALGMCVDDIDFLDGDTELIPSGGGTAGSRSAQIGGNAVAAAADIVAKKAQMLASHLLEASIEDLQMLPAGIQVLGSPSSLISWAELAVAASDATQLPPGMEIGLRAAPGFKQSDTGTAPFGCHIAVVEVDRDTGKTVLKRLVAVDDCGVILNPALADGQVHGGLAGGIGQALFEEIRYDSEGNPLTATLVDYAFPSAAEFPSFELGHTVTPSPHNPLGVKGIGEAGTTGALAAVHNAVVDAVSHLGIPHIDLPLSPERVWHAINSVAKPSTPLN